MRVCVCGGGYVVRRFQVLNLPVSPIYEPGINFDVLSYVGYGRFAASKYPFLCWEPSDQAIFTSVCTLNRTTRTTTTRHTHDMHT